jgi:hypothetical protein
MRAKILSSSGVNTSLLNSCFDRLSSFTCPNTSHNWSFVNCAFEATGAGEFQIKGTNIKSITLSGQAGNIGTLYGDGVKFSGTIVINTTTFTFTNCFWTADMGFNAPSKDVYTLKTSPQSKLFNKGNIIGKYGLHVYFDCNSAAFDPANSGVSYTNITRNTGTGNFELTSPNTSGVVVSTDNAAQAITLPTTATFNSDFVVSLQGFTFLNGEWADRLNYDAATNPEVRLTYRIAVYNEVTLAWGAWLDMELFTRPEQDSSARGNGNVDATMTALGALTGRRFRLEITLRNNGV